MKVAEGIHFRMSRDGVKRPNNSRFPPMGRERALETSEVSESPTLPQLPEEIWEMILSHLTTLDDLRNAAGVSRDWRRILGPSKHLWLFPKVFPFLTTFLSRNDILNCRGVSTHWRQGADEFIQGAEYLAPYNERHPPGRELRRRTPLWKQADRNSFRWLGCPDTMRFNGHLTWSPFVWREIAIHSIYDFDDFVTPTVTVGPHVRYLHLDLGGTNHVVWLYASLQVALKKLPNLRQLRLNVRLYGITSCCPRYSVPEFLLPLSLPTSLKTLQLEHAPEDTYDFCTSCGSPTTQIQRCESCPFEEALVRDHSHVLGRLEVNRWNLSWHLLSWPNLTELHVRLPCSRMLEWNVLRGLSKLVAPKLGKLFLKFAGPTDRGGPQQIFKLLQQFPRLRNFGMAFRQPEMYANGPMGRLLVSPWLYDYDKRVKGDAMLWSNFDKLLNKDLTSFPLINTLNLPDLPCFALRSKVLPVYFPNLEWLNCQRLNYFGGVENRLQMPMNGYDFHVPGFGTELSCRNCNGDSIDLICLDELHILSDFWMLFPRLKGIKTGGVGGRVNTRVEFEQYARSLRGLILHGDHPTVFASLGQMTLPNVTQLKLVFPQNPRPYLGDRDKERLIKSFFCFPNLTKLEIASKSFHFLANVLEVSLPITDHLSQSPFPSVKLLRVNQLPISEGFMAHFPNLECLEFDSANGLQLSFKGWWRWDPILYESFDAAVHQLELVKTVRLRRLYGRSRIWSMLPSLKSFHFLTNEGGTLEEFVLRDSVEVTGDWDDDDE